MRPLPSLSTTHTVPVSAMAKLAPLMATGVSRKSRRRKARAAAVSAGAVSAIGPPPMRA
jgi:hypothetical protein